jgi:hypothetical protein
MAALEVRFRCAVRIAMYPGHDSANRVDQHSARSKAITVNCAVMTIQQAVFRTGTLLSALAFDQGFA